MQQVLDSVSDGLAFLCLPLAPLRQERRRDGSASITLGIPRTRARSLHFVASHKATPSKQTPRRHNRGANPHLRKEAMKTVAKVLKNPSPTRNQAPTTPISAWKPLSENQQTPWQQDIPMESGLITSMSQAPTHKHDSRSQIPTDSKENLRKQKRSSAKLSRISTDPFQTTRGDNDPEATAPTGHRARKPRLNDSTEPNGDGANRYKYKRSETVTRRDYETSRGSRPQGSHKKPRRVNEPLPKETPIREREVRQAREDLAREQADRADKLAQIQYQATAPTTTPAPDPAQPSTTPGPTIQPMEDGPGFRLPNPEPFTGDVGKAKTFLLQLQSKINGEPKLRNDHGMQISYASLLLRNSAAEWALGYKGATEGTLEWNTLEDFLKDFRHHFIDPNPVGTALSKLEAMAQGRSEGVAQDLARVWPVILESGVDKRAGKQYMFRGRTNRNKQTLIASAANIPDEDEAKEMLKAY
ncbi:MAG: hypothetical protein M1816_005595 [Peltula sp. TS41687]|nr:MAG: hypothetical protein M1816_005595 [Peltula sp. TS41687]